MMDEPVSHLRPVGVADAPVRAGTAIRATRYGHARAFFFDDRAYPEHDGFWTRANGRAKVVIDTDEGTRSPGLPIFDHGRRRADDRHVVGRRVGKRRLRSPRGQKQDVTLPPASDGAWPLSIRSGAGFRPSEREPGQSRRALLAAWIAIH